MVWEQSPHLEYKEKKSLDFRRTGKKQDTVTILEEEIEVVLYIYIYKHIWEFTWITDWTENAILRLSSRMDITNYTS